MIDINKRKATVRGERMELTNKEFDLLVLLAKNPGKTFSRHELLELIWGVAFSGYEHTITSHINRLRIKIESNLHHPEYILTAWGTGYRFFRIKKATSLLIKIIIHTVSIIAIKLNAIIYLIIIEV